MAFNEKQFFLSIRGSIWSILPRLHYLVVFVLQPIIIGP